MSAWKLLDNDFVAVGNYLSSMAAGIAIWLHFEVPLHWALFIALALFLAQGLCLLSRYTAWIALLAGSAALSACVGFVAWLVGEHYQFAPIACAVAGGIIGAGWGVFGYLRVIQKYLPRPGRN